MINLPPDYIERVYAGVLGKLIGVYLGRPFEGWTYERIMAELGEIWYYVHDRRGVPLIVTDDDITGTFTFLRAAEDYGLDVTAEQIGQSWLNYIIEGKTILWWGGRGYSTEHTAYLNLKRGIRAPESGSIRRNGKLVAEQIGAQIFIDGWAMIAPNDPARAAELARRAASVSHDGEAVYAAQVWVAMESAAFSEPDIAQLLDIGRSFIPPDSTIRRLIDDVQTWHAGEPDWRRARERLAANYGYDKYGGACHVVPNHGLMILSLLYGTDDFHKTLMIVNTGGWDTDCNSGNVGCLLGIKQGLAALASGPDWRGPVADRLYLPTADGGRAISDAVTTALWVANMGRRFAGLPAVRPKDGARFHFELPGSVQAFTPDNTLYLRLMNQPGHSDTGRRSLAVHYQHPGWPLTVSFSTPTFVPPAALDMKGYALLASPTLYPGQIVRARLSADEANAAPITCVLFIQVYGERDELIPIYGSEVTLSAQEAHTLTWELPDVDGAPIAAVGIALHSKTQTAGTLYLDYLTWDGTPQVVFRRAPGTIWQRAWVDAVSRARAGHQAAFHVVQNEGVGLLITGTRDWVDYQVEAEITPFLCRSAGLGVRVQGMARYYALLLCNQDNGDNAHQSVKLIKALDGMCVLAQTPYDWQFDRPYRLRIAVQGSTICAWVNDQRLFEVVDDVPLDGGGIALVIEEGCLSADEIRIGPPPHS